MVSRLFCNANSFQMSKTAKIYIKLAVITAKLSINLAVSRLYRIFTPQILNEYDTKDNKKIYSR